VDNNKRVAIAQAIACHPPLVIADEPTTALDVVAQIEILALLKSLKEKLQMAVLMITHDTWPLTQFVDRVLVMYAGRIIEEGPARQVLERPLHPYTYGLLRSRPMGQHKRTLVPISGEPPDPANLPAGCAFSPRCSDVMNVCQTRSPQHFSPETSHQVACFKYAE
jgi:peptide/nickel transport system ATP-binding protein